MRFKVKMHSFWKELRAVWAICIKVWKDFYYYRGGIYRHKWGRLVGGHLMGYDDRQ